MSLQTAYGVELSVVFIEMGPHAMLLHDLRDIFGVGYKLNPPG